MRPPLKRIEGGLSSKGRPLEGRPPKGKSPLQKADPIPERQIPPPGSTPTKVLVSVKYFDKFKRLN